MKINGQLNGLSVDWKSGRAVMGFATDTDKEVLQQAYDLLKGKNLDLDVKIHREKKSKSANGYMWELLDQMSNRITEIAPYMHISRNQLYESYIDRCSKIQYDEAGVPVTMSVTNPLQIKLHEGHWKWLDDVKVTKNDGTEFISYMYVKLRGSSTFDSKEMSDFIGYIVDDCKDYGIETMTPAEIMEMDRAYKARYGK